MKHFLILILAILQSTWSHNITTEKSNNISKLKWKITSKHYKNFKCPPIENLLCVRVRSKKVGIKSKDIHMILFNECELDYVKCHQGYQATIVPMKYCGHHDKLIGKTRSKRSLRGLKKPVVRVQDSSQLSESEESDDKATYSDTEEDYMKKNKNKNKKGKKQKEPSETENSVEDQSDTEQDTAYIQSDVKKDTENSDVRLDDTQGGTITDDTQMESGTDDTKLESGTGSAYDSATSEEDMKGKYKSLGKHHSNDTQRDTENSQFDQQKDQIQMMGHIDYDLNATNEGVDFDEYEKDCPSFCPAREVMICARCKDGIYRTFMSVCHLRMFNCAHKEEKAELVSRYPCILSAPYLAEAPAPKGRVAEPNDVDLVLQYIRCREKEERERGDPKCAYILDNSVVPTDK